MGASRQVDRAAGVLVGTAVGDALGAGYEFGSAPFPADGRARMIGGGLGGFAPGEWTDDTAMTVAVAQALADRGVDTVAIGERFLDWLRSDPDDIGTATRAVLLAARDGGDLPRAARDHLADHPHGGAGNGALMRTAPVALLLLGQDAAMVDAARDVAALTHADPLAGDACVLWCMAIDRALREDRFDGIRDGLDHLPAPRRERWTAWLDEAATAPPERFVPNGFTVPALQAAWSVCVQTPGEGTDQLQAALHRAVGIGDDTDTVAAIAGALLGARWGRSAVPEDWQAQVHGWPGLRVDDLAELVVGLIPDVGR